LQSRAKPGPLATAEAEFAAVIRAHLLGGLFLRFPSRKPFNGNPDILLAVTPLSKFLPLNPNTLTAITLKNPCLTVVVCNRGNDDTRNKPKPVAKKSKPGRN
jgi:hypothetical protein